MVTTVPPEMTMAPERGGKALAGLGRRKGA
jgi:hypothetical protein